MTTEESPDQGQAGGSRSTATKTKVSVDGTADTELELRRDAAKWRVLASCPHTAELIADWLEWHRRARCRQASNAVAASCDWRARSTVPTYAELERRRSTYSTPAQTPEQIRRQAAASWAVIDGGRA